METRELCLVCTVKTESGDRRVLFPEVQLKVRMVWEELVNRKLQARGGSWCLDKRAAVGDENGPGYVCRKCFRMLEKYHKLQESLLEKLGKAVEVFGTQPGQKGPQAGVSAAQKRRVDEQEIVQPAKRQKLPSSPVAAKTTADKRLVFATDPGSATTGPGPDQACAVQKKDPPVTITVGYGKPKTYILPPSRQKLGKLLARGNRWSIAKQCLSDPVCRDHMINEVAKLVTSEVKVMCSDEGALFLLGNHAQDLSSFSWSRVLAEMKKHAPILLKILQRCTEGPGRNVRENQDAIVGLIACVLCKNRRPSMSLFQKKVSVILYAGHTAKQVYGQLQKLMICTSHHNTISTLDTLGEDFDKQTRSWRDSQLCTFTTQSASASLQAEQLKSLNSEEGDKSESEDSIMDAEDSIMDAVDSIMDAVSLQKGIDDSMDEAQATSLPDPSEASSTGLHPIIAGPLTPPFPEHIPDQPGSAGLSGPRD